MDLMTLSTLPFPWVSEDLRKIVQYLKAFYCSMGWAEAAVKMEVIMSQWNWSLS